jgi:hypothetical protein
MESLTTINTLHPLFRRLPHSDRTSFYSSNTNSINSTNSTNRTRSINARRLDFLLVFLCPILGPIEKVQSL